ncbi:probable mediator of RNA polymerase II transcription subunit 26c isoform X2 [Helianthus annuus]|uniref:probable mediator of RNA polymerase II transcription subunit 26c isoform X2 n=1 Tax=Helianthus annuus TaxID=4232 RepID=UPI000B8FE845|nr:probable mediator of RNA polymerase II transcription subunit 26c isoform X2 [Helianthus annuus]
MDLDEFKAILSNSTADVWGIIDAAITVASTEYSGELKRRRDGIVQRLYSERCSNCDVDLSEQIPNGVGRKVNDDVRGGDDDVRGGDDDVRGGDDSPLTPQEDEDDEPDPYGGLFDDEQSKVLRIKEQLEDSNQTDDAIADLLQTLADMDLTFTVLKETDIGRNVNRLRKHPSNEVRGLVKQLVRKWKDLVDEWVGSNNSTLARSTLTDGDSPLVQNVPRGSQNGYQQRTQREEGIDMDRLASARKRLQENYQEAQNAKKERKIQMMDIHEIPKPRNGFIARNKGNFHGRQNR